MTRITLAVEPFGCISVNTSEMINILLTVEASARS